MPENVPFFRKENEREQSGHDYRRAGENRVNPGTNIKERDRLGDLMDHVRERGDQAEGKRAQIEQGCAAPDAEGDERCDGEAGDAVAVEVLRPNIVVTQQVKLKQRWKRPNDNSGEKGQISA